MKDVIPQNMGLLQSIDIVLEEIKVDILNLKTEMIELKNSKDIENKLNEKKLEILEAMVK